MGEFEPSEKDRVCSVQTAEPNRRSVGMFERNRIEISVHRTLLLIKTLGDEVTRGRYRVSYEATKMEGD